MKIERTSSRAVVLAKTAIHFGSAVIRRECAADVHVERAGNRWRGSAWEPSARTAKGNATAAHSDRAGGTGGCRLHTSQGHRTSTNLGKRYGVEHRIIEAAELTGEGRGGVIKTNRQRASSATVEHGARACKRAQGGGNTSQIKTCAGVQR